MVLKRALTCLFVLTLASGVLLAQSSDLKVAHTTHSGPITPSAKPSPKLTTIFSNLGPTSTNAYNDTTGYYVLGPDNSVGLPEQGIGVPFIPAANAHVEQLQVAVGWESGTSLVNVGLYSDNAGVIGTLLSTGHASTIPVFGTCCQLVTVNIKSTAVTAGTQYWIVVTSDDTKAPDFTGVFSASQSGDHRRRRRLGRMVLIHHQYSRCRRSWFGPINKSAASRIRAASKPRPYFCAEAQRVVSPWSFVARPYLHSNCKRVESPSDAVRK